MTLPSGKVTGPFLFYINFFRQRARKKNRNERMIRMILKYQNNGVWGYIDNVRQVEVDGIDVNKLIAQYNQEVENKEREDSASYFNGSPVAGDIAATNKVYLMATEDELLDDLEGKGHQENLLAADLVMKNFYAAKILLYLNDHKDYDNVVLITNQQAYLMNDSGKTIERLV